MFRTTDMEIILLMSALRSLKFFIQFLFYTALFTAYLTGILAWIVRGYKSDVHLFVAIGLAGFFLLFSLGMVGNCLSMVFRNVTTIELVSKRIYMAVILPAERQLELLAPPPPAKISSGSSDHDSDRPTTSELDDPSHINYFQRQQNPIPRRNTSSAKPSHRIWKGTITYPLLLPTDRPPIPAPPQRTFAILQLPPGLNPWNLGSAYANFTAVFGTSVLDWLLPLKHSPCCDHSTDITEYPLGPEFELMLRDAGVSRQDEGKEGGGSVATGATSSSEKRRRKRILDEGWQDGERPDGWVSQKEARRMRKHWESRARTGKHPDLI
jgi:palmitoyltransferase